MTYIGRIQNVEVFIKLTQKRARIQINTRREFSNESIFEILNFMLKYYYNNLQLFRIRRGALVASIQNCELHLYIEKEDIYYIMQNIKQSIMQVTCEKYKRDNFCFCNIKQDTNQLCIYNKLIFKDKYQSGIIITAMPEVGAKNILEAIISELKY